MSILYILPIVLLLITGSIALIIFSVIRRVRHTMTDLFGTDDLKQLINTRQEEEANTPKSVSGMTSLVLPRIQNDFPELNWYELRDMAEKELFAYCQKKGLTDLKIHQSAILDYTKKAGTCIIVFQFSVQYFKNSQKKQARYNASVLYVQDADKYGDGSGFSVTCPHCGGAITSLGKKHCDYCGSEVLPINIRAWRFHKIEPTQGAD